tara:strand:- start:142 stop:1305 length:1164 start_codon:yes stop_codon:yes gene_type:complete
MVNKSLSLGSNNYILINSLSKKGGAEKQCCFVFKKLEVKKIFLINDLNDYEDLKVFSTVLVKGRYNRFFKLVFSVIKLSKKISETDTVISFMELSNFINIITKIIYTKHRCIISVRISPDYYKSLWFGNLIIILMKLLYPFSDRIITNSKDNMDSLKKIIHTSDSKFEVINNAIDLKAVKNVKITNYLPKKYLISMGRLVDQKNIFFQISLIKYLKKLGKNYKLLILGDGPLKDKIKLSINSVGLEYSSKLDKSDCDIIMLGHKDEPMSYFGNRCIFLSTSFNEGMPNSMLEAMARAVPIISSNCPTGPKELLAENELFEDDKKYYKNGVLLPIPSINNLDLSNWSGVVIELMDNSNLYNHFSKRSVLKAEQFSSKIISTAWKESLI